MLAHLEREESNVGTLFETFAHELNELFVAHDVGGAFRDYGLFKLGSFAQVVHELLLNRAGAGDVNLIRVFQMVADFLEILFDQGYFEIVRGILVRISPRAGIFRMTEDDEFGAGGIVAYDGRVLSVQPNSELLFGFF